MATAVGKRKIIRSVFTKTYNNLLQLLREESPDVSHITARFQVFEHRYVELSEIDNVILEDLCKAGVDESGAERMITEEIEVTDEYKFKYYDIKEKIKRLNDSFPGQSAESSLSEGQKQKYLRLPKLELRKYDGRISQWISFWSQFSCIHNDTNLSLEEKFQYLIQATLPGSRARSLVDSYPPSGENYEKVISALKDRFGREDLLVEFYIRELLKIVCSEKTMKISELYDRLETQLRSLETLNIVSDQYAAILYPLVESCLPSEILKIWQRGNSDKSAPLKVQMDKLLEFLRNEVQGEEKTVLALSQGQSEPKFTPKRQDKESSKEVGENSRLPTASSLANINRTTQMTSNCAFCNREHASIDCYDAQKMCLDDIRQALFKANLCFACTKIGHNARRCRAKCVVCKGRHVPLLCPKLRAEDKGINKEDKNDDKQEKRINNEERNYSNSANRLQAECPTSVSSLTAHPLQNTYLQTFMVYVYHGCRRKKARVLIDTGSQKSYIRRSLAKELQCVSEGQECLTHMLFGDNATDVVRHECYRVGLLSLDAQVAKVVCVLDQDNIASCIPSVPLDCEWKEELAESQIELAEDTNSVIDVLIGADIAGKIWTGRTKTLSCGIVAVQTIFGWTLMGKCLEGPELHSVSGSFTLLSIAQGNIGDLWKLDSIGINDPAEKKSKEERQLATLTHFKNHVMYCNGRYQVRLPWKEPSLDLPTNRELAIGRLIRCTKKMKFSGNLFSDYKMVMTEWLNDGIIEPDVGTMTGHYLPHRPVVKSASTTKVRPVFDASAKIEGFPSLNDCLEGGPNLIELIPAILARFRDKKMGISADIKRAFLQISVHPEDREFLKFLWWNEAGDEIITYRHTRVVFGVTSSPFLLGAVLDHHLEKSANNIQGKSLEYINLLRKSFYVDNLVTSLDSLEEALDFMEISRKVLAEASFDLRGWEFSDVGNPQEESLVLGVRWNKIRDTLRLNFEWWISVDSKLLTKRTVLSIGQRIFDPIGFTIPATLFLKLFIRSLWEKKVEWDDPLDEDMRHELQTWLRSAHLIGNIEVKRCVTHSSRKNISLHCFCDASSKAYAAVIFVRSNDGEDVKIELLQAKSRLAPSKETSMPRLELLAATIGARLLKNSQEALGWSDIPCYMWTDSSTVLAWICRQEEWSVFVRNRVKEIRELTLSEVWRHVPGSINPADLPSRGCNPEQLVGSRWWEGPSWLKEEEASWPQNSGLFEEEEIATEKVKKTVVLFGTSNRSCNWIYDSISKFETVIRVMAWIIRFCDNCRSKSGRFHGNLSVQELEGAEMVVLRLAQKESLISINDERIRHLHPFKDTCGVIRLKTRIVNRQDTLTFRMPAVLLHDHPLAGKLVIDFHKRYNHVGVETLLGKIREKLWIIKGRTLARKVIRKCETCRRFNAKHFDNDSPPLPLGRVKDALVFEVIGIDFAGPLILKSGQKVWVALFTCALYRAVHFELVSSLTTDSFLLALRRFIARRGRPRLIYSDNGTNFRGAENILRRVDWKKIIAFSSVERIEWIFNPPSASWWGGFWERIVGLLKRLLRRTLGRAALDTEELHTILCDCEAQINARPLTYTSESNGDPLPITPAMFLREIQQSHVPDLDMLEAEKFRRRLRYRYTLREQIRKRFRTEYLGKLTWCRRNVTKEPKIGQVVLIGSDNVKRLEWPLATVDKLIRGRDGKVRVLQLNTSKGVICRPIQRVYPLEIEEE